MIDNAIKFTEEGGVDVQVQAGRHNRLSIIVNDTGIGMTRQQVEQIFHPFVQADSSTTRRFGGTGLGLFLSKRLAQALQGDIEVLRCSPNEGCTFEFSFVAEATQLAQSIQKDNESNAPFDTSLAGSRILLAEDALDTQLLVSTILSAHGANVEIANNGAEAVFMAMHNNFDVILMDLQMPKMDGYEATRTLRESGYSGPIVALTAHAMKEDRERTKGVGCNCHLTKPLKVDDLLKTIQHYS